jgi:hypothetical protein
MGNKQIWWEAVCLPRHLDRPDNARKKLLLNKNSSMGINLITLLTGAWYGNKVPILGPRV